MTCRHLIRNSLPSSKIWNNRGDDTPPVCFIIFGFPATFIAGWFSFIIFPAAAPSPPPFPASPAPSSTGKPRLPKTAADYSATGNANDCLSPAPSFARMSCPTHRGHEVQAQIRDLIKKDENQHGIAEPGTYLRTSTCAPLFAMRSAIARISWATCSST